MNISLKISEEMYKVHNWRNDGVQKTAFNSWFWVHFLFPLGECDLLGFGLKGLMEAG
jgi:hypothetical protein